MGGGGSDVKPPPPLFCGVPKMDLREYMEKMNVDIIKVASNFGVSVHAVKKWLRKERIPRPKMQAKIKILTKGLVDGNDWVPKE